MKRSDIVGLVASSQVATSLLFRVSSARGFLGMGQWTCPKPGRTASTRDRLARPLSSARLLFAICVALALGACGIGDSPSSSLSR